ncbi:hypothetical protein BU15DRAFT_68494 [Melanogaster broomeanus]|nr:hypothetical protein BU15DRAFT_68494 [Melanogaster broomeanus]
MSSFDHHDENTKLSSKHQCSLSQACNIKLSEIGKNFHIFPTGTFKSRYTPPALPTFVIEYYIQRPFTWDWSIRSGPNQGKTFLVPTIPTACTKNANQATKWTVDLFYSFKAQIAPQLLRNGKIPSHLIRLYQSNMVLHFKTQAAALVSTRRNARIAKMANIPPPLNKTSFADQLNAPISIPPSHALQQLQAEIMSLKNELEKIKAENTLLRSQVAVGTANETSTPASTVPKDSEALKFQLEKVLNFPECPTFLRSVTPKTELTKSYTLPSDITECCKVTCVDGNMHVAQQHTCKTRNSNTTNPYSSMAGRTPVLEASKGLSRWEDLDYEQDLSEGRITAHRKSGRHTRNHAVVLM